MWGIPFDAERPKDLKIKHLCTCMMFKEDRLLLA